MRLPTEPLRHFEDIGIVTPDAPVMLKRSVVFLSLNRLQLSEELTRLIFPDSQK